MAVIVYKYQDVIADPSTGRPVSGAAVTVKLHGSGTLATLYDETGEFEQDNPVYTDSNGFFQFYAPAGRHDFDCSFGGGIASRRDVLIGIPGTIIHSDLAGLKGDGVTDNGPAMEILNSWLAGSRGAVVIWAEGHYMTSVPFWPCGYGINVIGSGKVVVESIDGGDLPYALIIGNPDPGDLSTSNRLQADMAVGDAEIILLTVAGYKVDDVVYVFSGRSTNSSGDNQIPLFKQFFTIQSIDTVNKKLIFTSKAEYDFNVSDDAAVFTSTATPAVGVTIENIHFTNKAATFSGAYLHAVSYGLGITLKNVRLDGYSAVGLTAFVDKLLYDNCTLAGYAGFASARGTKRITFRDSTFNQRNGAGTENWGAFMEETPERVVFENCDIKGKVYLGTSSDSLPVKQFIMRNSKITSDTMAIRALGAYNETGYAIDLDRCVFDAPGIAGAWNSSRKTVIELAFSDTARITNCEFINADADSYAIDAGNTWSNTRADLSGNSYGTSLGVNTTVVDNVSLYSITGTFTPQIKINGSATGISHTYQLGRYIKLGNKVKFQTRISLVSKGTGEGAVTIQGLPFPLVDVANFEANFTVFPNNLATAWGTKTVFGNMLNGDTVISLYKLVDGVASPLLNTDLTDTSAFDISGSYEI